MEDRERSVEERRILSIFYPRFSLMPHAHFIDKFLSRIGCHHGFLGELLEIVARYGSPQDDLVVDLFDVQPAQGGMRAVFQGGGGFRKLGGHGLFAPSKLKTFTPDNQGLPPA